MPWLSDISFDGNELVLGLRDTNGDRMGNDVRSPNITTNTALPTKTMSLMASQPRTTAATAPKQPDLEWQLDRNG